MTTNETPPLSPTDSPVGRNELGVISVSDRAVQDIAVQAVAESPDAGGAAPRVLGRAVPGAGALGMRPTSLTALPKARARVDGSVVTLDLSMSIRWPASVPEVTSAVRDHVRSKVSELTGLTVLEISISVTALVTDTPTSPRVR